MLVKKGEIEMSDTLDSTFALNTLEKVDYSGNQDNQPAFLDVIGIDRKSGLLHGWVSYLLSTRYSDPVTHSKPPSSRSPVLVQLGLRPDEFDAFEEGVRYIATMQCPIFGGNGERSFSLNLGDFVWKMQF